MRIALLCNLVYPIAEPFAGGLERQTHQLATGLVAAGAEVTLFAHPKSDSRFELVPIALSDTPRTRGPVHTYRRVRAYRQMMRAVVGGDFDVVHNNTLHWLPPVWLALQRLPSLTTLHTPPYRSLKLAAVVSRLYKQPLAISISATLGTEWTAALGYAPEVVPNGIDPAKWPFSEHPHPKNALWYGRISPEKAPHLAIRAARAAGYRILLAGRVDDREYFQQQVEPLLRKGGAYLGSVKSEELKRRIGQAAVCLFTSLWREPFGLVLLEAPICGTPVVALNTGAVPEVLGLRMGVCVPMVSSSNSLMGAGAGAGTEVDEEAIVASLAAAIPVAGRMDRAACRAEVISRFSLDQMVAGYLTIYRRIQTRAIGQKSE